MIAGVLRCPQGTVSKVEGGHLPRPWERDRWANAYKLDVLTFETLVKNAKRMKALSKTVMETEPLMATAQNEAVAVVTMDSGQGQEVRTA